METALSLLGGLCIMAAVAVGIVLAWVVVVVVGYWALCILRTLFELTLCGRNDE